MKYAVIFITILCIQSCFSCFCMEIPSISDSENESDSADQFIVTLPHAPIIGSFLPVSPAAAQMAIQTLYAHKKMPIMDAITKKSYVQHLKKCGAQLDIERTAESYGFSILHAAINAHEDPAFIEFLCSEGANINALECNHFFARKTPIIACAQKYGWTMKKQARTPTFNHDAKIRYNAIAQETLANIFVLSKYGAYACAEDTSILDSVCHHPYWWNTHKNPCHLQSQVLEAYLEPRTDGTKGDLHLQSDRLFRKIRTSLLAFFAPPYEQDVTDDENATLSSPDTMQLSPLLPHLSFQPFPA